MDESLLRQALIDTFDIRYEQYNLDDLPDYVPSKKFERKMNKLISRQKKPYFVLIATTARRVACIVVCIIVIAVSTLRIEAVREQFAKFFINIFDDHLEININKTQIDDLNDYNIDNLIYNIPDGFELYYSSDSEIIKTQEYRKDELYIILTSTISDNANIMRDNEKSNYEAYYDSNGMEYIVCYTEDLHQTNILWMDGVYLNQITTNIDREKIFEIFN